MARAGLSGLTVVVVGVRRLVVVAVEAVQVGHVRQQPKDAVPVVRDLCDVTVEQLQAPQVLQVLLQRDRVGLLPVRPVRACVRARALSPASPGERAL